jgi:hypothetical protein
MANEVEGKPQPNEMLRKLALCGVPFVSAGSLYYCLRVPHPARPTEHGLPGTVLAMEVRQVAAAEPEGRGPERLHLCFRCEGYGTLDNVTPCPACGGKKLRAPSHPESETCAACAPVPEGRGEPAARSCSFYSPCDERCPVHGAAASRSEHAAAACATCGKPATCYGVYEDPSAPAAYACDDCCGHGNEDGHCEPVSAAGVEDPAPPAPPTTDNAVGRLRRRLNAASPRSAARESSGSPPASVPDPLTGFTPTRFRKWG